MVLATIIGVIAIVFILSVQMGLRMLTQQGTCMFFLETMDTSFSRISLPKSYSNNFMIILGILMTLKHKNAYVQYSYTTHIYTQWKL